MKNIRGFLPEKFRFLQVKFSTYLNKRVFVRHSLPGLKVVQSNLNSSNANDSFTMANSNTFSSPL